MKKHTRIILIVCTAIICVTAALLFTGVIGGRTVYLPETVKVVEFDAKTGQSKQRAVITHKYDSNNHLKALSYSGWPRGTQEVTCDRYGNVITINGTIQLSDDLLGVSRYTYSYSATGQPLVTLARHGDSWIQREHTYNIRGLLTQVIDTKKTQSSELVTTTKYTYNLAGKLISADAYLLLNNSESTTTHTDYEYNDAGQLILETFYNANNAVVRKVEYRYENGNTIATKTSYSESEPSVRIYVFDHVGNLIELRYGSDSSNSDQFLYTYRKVRVSLFSPLNNFTYLYSLSETGIADQKNWNYFSHVYGWFWM